MKKIKLILMFFVFFNTAHSQENNYKIENFQDRKSLKIINELEKNNIDSVIQYFDSKYFNSNKSKIFDKLSKFTKEVAIVKSKSKRYKSLSFPIGFNEFMFRYIDSTGILLQISFYFKIDKLDSEILKLEIIDLKTFQELNKTKDEGIKFIRIGKEPKITYPRNTILEYSNCSYETRTVTFTTQLTYFKNWVRGQGNLETNKVVNFSPNYKLDTSFIRQNTLKIKNSLPKNFWNFSTWGERYDKVPNEESIWFMHLLSQVEKNGNIKIFAGIKITFEGTDARIEKNRVDPKIINVEYITDKKQLIKLENELKVAKRL
jgi:hypothetical protein